jgi:hypothetical protein
MSVTPTVSYDGIGVISAGQLNAYMLGALNTAVMRTIVGQPGMTVYLQGTNVPNDGGQGWFYWNYASIAADNNSTIIVPNGVVQGAWIRQAIVISNVGPAFSAYANSGLSVTSATATKVQINTKEFDTNAAFDNTTNYRYTPQTAGYYQVSGTLTVGVTTGTSGYVAVYKNGSVFKNGTSMTLTSGNFSVAAFTVNDLIYLNGSTDYIELWGSVTGTSPSFTSGAAQTNFSAFLARNQ